MTSNANFASLLAGQPHDYLFSKLLEYSTPCQRSCIAVGLAADLVGLQMSEQGTWAAQEVMRIMATDTLPALSIHTFPGDEATSRLRRVLHSMSVSI